MSKAELAKLTKGVNALKRMATRLLSTPKKATGTKKAKGTKKARNNQKGGSTISYTMPGRMLSSSESAMASPAPIAASDGHAFYDMSNTKGAGSFI